jgi:polyisoprenoid-binding protein YceI
MEHRKVTQQTAAAVWTVDPKYTTVEFSVKLLSFFTVEGRFTDVTGTIVRDEADIRRSSVDVAIKAASIETGNRRRDAHLRSADFLDVKAHPEIRFQSVSVEDGTDRDTLRIRANLTVRGKSRELEFVVEEVDHSRSPQGDEIDYYAALIGIDRFDLGISAFRGFIGRTLKVRIQIQAVKQNQ